MHLKSCLKLAGGSNRPLKLGAQPFAQVQGQIKRCIGFRSWHCAMGMGSGQLSRFCNGHEQYVGERVPLAVHCLMMSKMCLEKSQAMNNCELLLFLTFFLHFTEVQHQDRFGSFWSWSCSATSYDATWLIGTFTAPLTISVNKTFCSMITILIKDTGLLLAEKRTGVAF